VRDRVGGVAASAATRARTSSRRWARSRSAQIASQALPRAVRIRASPTTARSTLWTTVAATERTARGMLLRSMVEPGFAALMVSPYDDRSDWPAAPRDQCARGPWCREAVSARWPLDQRFRSRGRPGPYPCSTPFTVGRPVAGLDVGHSSRRTAPAPRVLRETVRRRSPGGGGAWCPAYAKLGIMPQPISW